MRLLGLSRRSKAISDAAMSAEHWEGLYRQMADKAVRLEQELQRVEKAKILSELRIEELERALGEIIMCKTPGANATVRRMARIAYKGLYDGDLL